LIEHLFDPTIRSRTLMPTIEQADGKGAVPSEEEVYRDEFTVPEDVIDRNGHVSNVAYVQWMQDAAVRHFTAVGGVDAMRTAGATWVVRSHRIEYRSPAFAGDRIQVLTWVVNFRRVRSLRRYEFVRTSDGVLLAKGETEWVFVDHATGRPRAIPEEIIQILPLAPEGPAS
jgi:acyl-CoA thioester hydrolase